MHAARLRLALSHRRRPATRAGRPTPPALADRARLLHTRAPRPDPLRNATRARTPARGAAAAHAPPRRRSHGQLRHARHVDHRACSASMLAISSADGRRRGGSLRRKDAHSGQRRASAAPQRQPDSPRSSHPPRQQREVVATQRSSRRRRAARVRRSRRMFGAHSAGVRAERRSASRPVPSPSAFERTGAHRRERTAAPRDAAPLFLPRPPPRHPKSCAARADSAPLDRQGFCTAPLGLLFSVCVL